MDVDDLTGTYEALKAKGISFTNAPQVVCDTPQFVGYSADFVDPDGNLVSIYGTVSK